MEWVTRIGDTFVRARERRRFRRGKRSDRPDMGRVLRRHLTVLWSSEMTAPFDWGAAGFKGPSADDIAFIRGEPGTYVIS